MQPAPEITYQDTPTGGKLELLLEGAAVSRVFIRRLQMRVGAAVVRAAGIGDVSTDEPYRRRGYMRLLMEEAVRRMRASDASLSILGGIPDVYHKFGYATTGPYQFIRVTDLPRGAPLAPGWRARPAMGDDLPAIRALYDRNTAGQVGPLVRDAPGPSWSGRAWALLLAALQQPDAGECRIVEAPDGHPAAYCWRGSDLWVIRWMEHQTPGTMAFAEVMADSPPAAEAAIAACRAWACEKDDEKDEARREGPVTSLTFSLPHRSLVGVAATFQDAQLILHYFRSGGSMARTLDVRRLLAELLPELSARLRAAGLGFDGVVRFVTDEGAAAVRLGPTEAALVETAEPPDGESIEIALPQTALARLVLGGYPPQDVLARIESPGPRAAELIAALFPLRRWHIYPADWP